MRLMDSHTQNLSDSDNRYFDSHYLKKCQVDTPLDIVKFAWDIAHEYSPTFDRVLDLGAGDGKFALNGNYLTYIGYEIDSSRISVGDLPVNAKIKHQCAFSEVDKVFDLCIGNPPYVRHHDLNGEWQQKIAEELSSKMGFRLDRRSNAFIYFLCQSLLQTKDNGLVIQVIPYEWVSRPATKFLRDYIRSQKWDVRVYRFEQDVFAHSKVLTTACVTVIDKSSNNQRWEYYRVDNQLNRRKVKSATGHNDSVLAYKKRARFNYAQRGLSPGGQKIFCLTEETRQKFALKVGEDVVPCIANIKPLPTHLKLINSSVFKRYFVNKGERCWLIKPNRQPSKELVEYLESIPFEERDNYTCNHQSPWWCYKAHNAPDLIYGSGFTEFGPRVYVNGVGAVVLGTVHGIHEVKGIGKYQLLDKLMTFNFETKLVSHSGVLKKIEVNQMNAVLELLSNE